MHTATTPLPAFLQLTANPLRWSLLRRLARSDHQVEELAALVEQPQNLVSYHLGRLRRADLVSARKSSRDGREVFYRLNVARCADLLSSAGGELHAALGRPAPRWEEPLAMADEPRVLFLCTENSARSQMAEGLLRHLSAATVTVASAGSRPGGVHPLAVATMAARGIDIRGHRSKHADEFAGQAFDAVVTVCDRVREACPEFPGVPERVHWSVADPAASTGDLTETFAAAAAELTERCGLLLRQLAAREAGEGIRIRE